MKTHIQFSYHTQNGIRVGLEPVQCIAVRYMGKDVAEVVFLNEEDPDFTNPSYVAVEPFSWFVLELTGRVFDPQHADQIIRRSQAKVMRGEDLSPAALPDTNSERPY